MVLTERLVTAVFKAAGGAEGIDLPLIDAEREVFSAALVAEPEPESAAQRLLRELGVA